MSTPVTSMFHEGSRALQAQHDTRRIADRIEELLVSDTIGPGEQQWIESADTFRERAPENAPYTPRSARSAERASGAIDLPSVRQDPTITGGA